MKIKNNIGKREREKMDQQIKNKDLIKEGRIDS